MRVITIRRFNAEASELREPVQITRRQELIGTFYPIGTAPDAEIIQAIRAGAFGSDVDQIIVERRARTHTGHRDHQSPADPFETAISIKAVQEAYEKEFSS